MSIHIGAKKGVIAEAVLLPGDPLRAKFIAENFLENSVEYSKVRGMYGYTGTYKGKKVSVQGTGMGIPSISIYVTELINDYGAKRLIRIGSCGSVNKDVKLADIVIAMAASTDSSFNKLKFNGMDYASAADYGLLEKAVSKAKELSVNYHVGKVLTSDTFYPDPDFQDNNEWKKWAAYGIIAEEMETAALYTIAARAGVEALSLLTVSDHFISKEAMTSEERQTSFTEMMEVALNTIV